MGRQKVEMSCGFFTSMLFSRDPSVQPKEGRTNNAKKKKKKNSVPHREARERGPSHFEWSQEYR